MPDLDRKPSLVRMFGKLCGYIGVPMVVFMVICMFNESLRSMATTYLVIGAALTAIWCVIVLGPAALRWTGNKLSGLHIGH